MKKLLFCCVILVLYQVNAFSQSCLPEGITFSTQEQIDSFQVNYPGCSTIEGYVIIYGDEISDLAGISVLDSIYGDLEIEYTRLLHDMTGLDNLNYIGGDLNIYWNDWLLNLKGLENLTAVDGSVEIDENFELTSLTGLDNLTSIGGSLLIGYNWGGNYSLNSLSGLDNLTSVGGGLMIAFNDNLTILTGLDNVTSIGGDLEIYYNASLTSLSGLENVNASSIGRIRIAENPVLSVCNIQSICDYLTDIHDIIEIYSNAPGCDNPHEIADSCGFTLSCLPFGNYYFTSQPDVDSFPSYYSNCNNLAGYVWIESDDLNNLDSLYGIDTITGRLFICGNTNLYSLNGLNNLRTIQGDLTIGYWEYGGNPGLTSMTGLNSLASISGGVLILGNRGLLNLSGLDSLTTIGEDLQIFSNERLVTLEGIENLNFVGSLNISGNDSLLNLGGLQGLINTGGYISVGYNPMLVTLDGMGNIDAGQITFLRITNNDTLTGCNVQSVCNYLINYSGNFAIVDNCTGCDNAQEVEAACGVGIEEVSSQQPTVSIYPNPIVSHTTFNFRLQESSDVKLMVFNSLGQGIATILDESLDKGNHLVTWNAENISPGIYFYRLSSIDHRPSAIGKMVVVR
jgi:hypothetical protein